MLLLLFQNDLVHGWGLDMKLGYCAQVRLCCFVAMSQFIPCISFLFSVLFWRSSSILLAVVVRSCDNVYQLYICFCVSS